MVANAAITLEDDLIIYGLDADFFQKDLKEK